MDATSETGTAYDYNDYFSASGTPFSWGGTAYTFCELADEQLAGCAFADSESLAERMRALSFGRELHAADGISGDRCGRESGVRVSDGAFRRGLRGRAAWGCSIKIAAGVGDRRVCVSRGNGTLPLMGCCD